MFFGFRFIFSSPYVGRIVRNPAHWDDMIFQFSDRSISRWDAVEFVDDHGFLESVLVIPANFDSIYSLFVEFGFSERLPWLLRYWSERFSSEEVSRYAL